MIATIISRLPTNTVFLFLRQLLTTDMDAYDPSFVHLMQINK